jgi:hypothetical protein
VFRSSCRENLVRPGVAALIVSGDRPAPAPTLGGGPLLAEGHCASRAAHWRQGAALWPIRSMAPMRRFPPELCSPGQQPVELPICSRVKDPPQPKGLGALLRCLRPAWSRWATAMMDSRCTSSPTHSRGRVGSTTGESRGCLGGTAGLPTAGEED